MAAVELRASQECTTTLAGRPWADAFESVWCAAGANAAVRQRHRRIHETPHDCGALLGTLPEKYAGTVRREDAHVIC